MTTEKITATHARFCETAAAANYALVEATVGGSAVLKHADNLARETGRWIREGRPDPGGYLTIVRGFSNALILAAAIWSQRNGGTVDLAAVSDALDRSGTITDIWADYVFAALTGETVCSASGDDERAVWTISAPAASVAAILAEFGNSPNDRSRAHELIVDLISASFGNPRHEE